MSRFRSLIIAVATVLALATSAREEAGAQAGTTLEAGDVSMGMPVTTSSDDARSHFMLGLHALDMGRLDDARPHFEQAIAADPAFGHAYLLLAFASNSVTDFKRNLDLAAQNGAGASEAEQLRIEITVKGFDGDAEGALAAAQQLVEVAPSSPRAWIALGDAQSNMGDMAGARASFNKATEEASDFAPAWMALGGSYLLEPQDLPAAQRAMERAVELEPEEAVTHDLLGDTYRAQGNLEQSAQEYTRTAELDTKTGNGFQQRGHVHSFLGRYQEARADYDAAIGIEDGQNQEASFGVYRALVSVHEGNARAAVDELNQLVGEIDGMGIPDPRGQKIVALVTIADIALHTEMFPEAEAAIADIDALTAEEAEEIGTDAARRDARAGTILGQGRLAARKGDYAAAIQQANEYMTTMASSTDPDRDQPAHALLGYVSLQQGDHDAAIAHFEQADPDDIYAGYYHALTLEGAGRAEEAKALFAKVGNNNFNSSGFALVRKDAIERSQ
jgi:tetratricopeptide (TPR) repeat protein